MQSVINLQLTFNGTVDTTAIIYVFIDDVLEQQAILQDDLSINLQVLPNARVSFIIDTAYYTQVDYNNNSNLQEVANRVYLINLISTDINIAITNSSSGINNSIVI